MDIGRRIVEGMRPGSMTAVVGRPSAGVSTTLAQASVAAADRRLPAVLACWERPPAAWPASFRRPDVRVPEIMNWDTDEFACSREAAEAGPGTVVAIDYLQLVGHPGDDRSALVELSALAAARRWRLVVGVMATRRLAALARDVGAPEAVRLVDRVLSRTLDVVDATIVLSGAAAGPRRATAASRAATSGGLTVDWSDRGTPSD